MKKAIVLFAILVSTKICSQIPNGSFESWEQESTWEVPSNWSTNNAEMDFVSVTKGESLTDGDYALRVVNKGLSFEGYDFGHAYCTFYPTGIYTQLELSYMIDSVSGGASVEILIFQLNNGVYEQIGSWQSENTTSGIEDLNIPINLVNTDSLQVEIRCNSLLTGTGKEGYAEIIVDELNLNFTSSIEQIDMDDEIHVYPNPSDGQVSVGELFIGSKYEIHDIEGRLIDFGELSSTTLNIKEEGLFILSIKKGDTWIDKKVIVKY